MTDDYWMHLEAYLDGELSPAEEAQLQGRARRDPALADDLRRLAASRQVRVAAIAAVEASPATAAAAQRLVASVRTAHARELAWASRLRIARVAGGMAACLLIGYFVGNVHTFDRPAGPSNGTIARPTANSSTQSNPANSGTTGVPVASDAGAKPGGFVVSVQDDRGRVIATHRFDTLEEASLYAGSINDLNERRPGKRNATRDLPEPEAVFISERF
jgi:hypothetical protein